MSLFSVTAHNCSVISQLIHYILWRKGAHFTLLCTFLSQTLYTFNKRSPSKSKFGEFLLEQSKVRKFALCTGWKVLKYVVFSGPYLPAFTVNTEKIASPLPPPIFYGSATAIKLHCVLAIFIKHRDSFIEIVVSVVLAPLWISWRIICWKGRLDFGL